MKILGIETSCDETSASIIEAYKDFKINILSNIVSSQIDLHKKYGGVFPELASRAHLENIIPSIKASLSKAKTNLENIDLIAATTGPGLIGSLLVGVNTAKTLAYSLDKPIIGVNHLEGHIYSAFGGEIRNSKLEINFPAIVLIVSGGHTSLILMKDYGKFEAIGQTRDDAAGEAFDKVAALLELPYPGGPAIEKEASKSKPLSSKLKIKLPRPMIDSSSFDFSFSGLKTAVLYLIKQFNGDRLKNVKRDIAHEFQQAVIDVLVDKTLKAANYYKVKTIMLSGGVSANSLLRREFERKTNFLVPPKNLCTDNAVMIAVAGYYKYSATYLKKKPNKWYNINANANEKLINW